MAKILCIDDSALIRSELRKCLESLKHEVVEAEDGLVGMESIQAHPDVKLIFCDVNMPRMNGIEFCEQLFKLTQFSHIPIFMFTTEASVDLKEKSKKVGVKGWIIKPFLPNKIILVVSKVLA